MYWGQPRLWPSHNPVRAEYEFRSRKQGPNETVSEYLTALRTLYIDCERPDQESHNLTMQLPLGCYNRYTQEKLLTETTVNLDRFVQIMQASLLTRPQQPSATRASTLLLFVSSVHHKS